MKKQYKAIFFDMDGTLLPMNVKEFTSGYFKLLAKRLAKYGYEPQKLVEAIWIGTKEMTLNDGSRMNDEVFWEKFSECFEKVEPYIRQECDDFYSKEFMEAICFTGPNPLAVEAVRAARASAPVVALATNPLFPMNGQVSRMTWIGLKPEDFDLVTSYETDRFCKPNPNYYLSVCERLGVEPSQCLMVGNDEDEDMYAATKAGLDCFLVTDCMIESKEHPWQGRRGTFPELVDFLKQME